MPNSDELGLEVAKAAAEGAGRESVNKVSEFFRTIFPFWGMKKSAVDTYVAEVQNSNLAPALKMMAIANTKQTFKHLKNQQRIVEIAESVAPEGTVFSSDSGVDEEWLERFMDSAKFVSDEQVQVIWGRILASEFANPNSTPPSITRILSEITPVYAKAFQIICSLSLDLIAPIEYGRASHLGKILIVPEKYEYLSEYKINFSTLTELQMLGLIQFEPLAGLIKEIKSAEYPQLFLVYGDKATTIVKYPDKRFPMGIIRLTDAGRSLSIFTERIIIEKHFDLVVQYLKDNKVEFDDTPSVSV